MTVALGGGFTADALYAEVRGAWAYRKLTRPEFQWALDFVVQGGSSLGAYPEYHRVVDVDGVYRVPDRGVARRHKLNVGTIVSDASRQVKYLTGGRIGVVEEGFVARLRPGDCFVFAGRTLEFIRAEEMTAYVKRATGNRAAMISWAGAKMPLSSELADAVLDVLAGAAQGDFFEPELEAARPMLETQMRLSRIPTPTTLLIERLESREGQHLFIYPFAGRNAHIGLGSLLAWRLARDAPNTFSISINDYGFELLSAKPGRPRPAHRPEPVRRRRAAARRAGQPEQQRAGATALSRDRSRGRPDQPGLSRAAEEHAPTAGVEQPVLRGVPQVRRRQHVADAGRRRGAEPGARHRPPRPGARTHARSTRGPRRAEVPSPFALPLMVERFREKLSTEKLKDRLERMLKEMEREAGRE